MKASKLELQQSLNRVNADLVHALEQLSEARGDLEAVQAIRRNLELEVATLRSKLNEADIRAKRLIASNNRTRSAEVSERAKAMHAAKLHAMTTGAVTKVGG